MGACGATAGERQVPILETGGLADVDGGAAGGVGFGAAEDLVGDGGDVALAEEDEAGEVFEGVALAPAEVDVGAAAGDVADRTRDSEWVVNSEGDNAGRGGPGSWAAMYRVRP